MKFTERYQALNPRQKQAVDTLEGPVMVVAGPGTGKTELLSMRAANILKQTDTLPGSILCLTFTESGAHAMRERLAQIIGSDAYKVAINTFHGFGSEVINQYGEYFYQGAQFRPADDLATHEILSEIFKQLKHSSPLASQMNGAYTYLKDVKSAIADLKRSGLTSDELIAVLDANQLLMDAVEPLVQTAIGPRVSKAAIAALPAAAKAAAALTQPDLPSGITPLSSAFAFSLTSAIDEARETNSTKPITAWKDRWLTKNNAGELVFKDRDRDLKLRAVSTVYSDYLSKMQAAELYDYDDMILRVVHAMEVFNNLRFDLQERYQYILVDEFQDTNLAQMRILANLTNNPAHGDSPNIMVVGDDDQAIYSFQGADISNIMSFRSLYPKTQLITLIDNYRSGQPILDLARKVIVQGDERLESQIESLDKTLKPHRQNQAQVTIHQAMSPAAERQWLAKSITEAIREGTQTQQIAVLARKHQDMIDLLPYLFDHGISVNYEKRDNVFELDSVKLLIDLARVINFYATQRIDEADRLLPKLLAHPAWGIKPNQLWQLSLKAYDSRRRWLDTMITLPEFAPLQNWLIGLIADCAQTPIERLFDNLIGRDVADEQLDEVAYQSPIFEYYFSDKALHENPDAYLAHLEALRTIRGTMRDHQPDDSGLLEGFINFVEDYQSTGQALTSMRPPAESRDGAINLMTVHKAKGLEFDTVFIVDATDSKWGERARARSSNIKFPENLPLAQAGGTADERLRLFYVAATRAKRRLEVSFAVTSGNNKPLELAGFLIDEAVTPIDDSDQDGFKIELEREWYAPVIDAPIADLKFTLQPILEHYKLSATHVGSFLDVTRGGPQAFLVHNLLRFPQAMAPAAAFGSAIHASLQQAHVHFSAHQKQRPLEDILSDFETELGRHRLDEVDFNFYLDKGLDALRAFLGANYDSFTAAQKVELNFAGQQAVVDGAHLTGKLDLVDIDGKAKTVSVTDYKTGKPSTSWKGASDYEKIKLHRYRQQLMFYKLLVENSRDFVGHSVTTGVLQFIEPTKSGEVVALESDFNSDELAEFRLLLQAVWQKIIALDLPDTAHYDQSFKGIIAFEDDLRTGLTNHN